MIKFKKLDSRAIIPSRATPGSAGFDFYALERTYIPFKRVLPVQTGLAVEIPPGHVLLVCPRSGHSLKYPVYVSNSPGVVDSDYRGELKILVFAHDEGIIIQPGERFAQGLVVPVSADEIVVVDDLSGTIRGEGGFGSTNAG